MANWAFNPFTNTLDITGSGGPSILDGEVDTFDDLPSAIGDPPVGSSFLVLQSTGVWLVNRRPRGIWVRTSNTGVRADDWSYGSEFPVNSVNGQSGTVVIGAGDISDFTTAAAAAAPVQSVNGNTGTVTVAVPSASTATPSALGVAAAGTASEFSRGDHVHALPSASDVGAVGATLLDAKGDLIVASANDTAARLAVSGTNGHVLTVDSAETLGVKWAAAGGGATTQTDIFTANGTWTKPAGAKMVQVELVGGGGGGGGGRRGAASTARGGGGGGAGAGRTVVWLHPDQLSNTVTVTVGAGGTAGTAAANDTDGGAGGAGGTTTFGPLNAYGGNGGAGGNASAAAAGGAAQTVRGFVLTASHSTIAGGTGGYEGTVPATGLSGAFSAAGGGGGARITAANATSGASGAGGDIAVGSGGVLPQLASGGAAVPATSSGKGNTGERLGFIAAGASGGRFVNATFEPNEGGDSIGGAGGGGGSGGLNDAGGSTAGGKGGDGVAVITTYF